MRSIQYGTQSFSYIKPVTKSTHLNKASNTAKHAANKVS